MVLLLSVFFFCLGAIVASFVLVLVVRVHTGKGVLRGRSHCDACGTSLPAFALVPIFSYMGMGGRSSCCGTRISPLSTICELVLGMLFLLAYMREGISLALIPLLVALAALIALVVYDLRHTVLPTTFLIIFVGAAFCFVLLSSSSVLQVCLLLVIALAIAASLLGIYIVSDGRAMGFSDAPLAFGLALLGSSAISGLVFSFWIGAVVGIVLLAIAPRHHRMSSEIPFAPFLAAGFLLAFFTQWNAFQLVASLMAFVLGN